MQTATAANGMMVFNSTWPTMAVMDPESPHKIKNMRKSGLEGGGEFSVENIAFKTLRRNGTLDRLSDLKVVAYDKMLTIENKGYL